MVRKLTQRELRNQSGEIMRALDRGEEFLVTRNGDPVAELRPIRPRQFVSTMRLRDALIGADPVDHRELRADVDSILDHDPSPRGWSDA